MSIANRFWVWRRASDLPVYRSLGLRPVTVIRGSIRVEGPERSEFWTQFRPYAGVDFTDREFTLDAFLSDDEGYGLSSTCPCGEIVSGDDVGELLREIDKHCDEAKHPKPRHEP